MIVLPTSRCSRGESESDMSDIVVQSAGLTTSNIVAMFAAGDFSKKWVITTDDPAEAQRRIAERDLNAQSVDDLLGGGKEAISGKEYLNKVFQVTDVEWQLSEYEGDGGLPFYAVIHAITLDGEAKVITSGATTVIRKLAVMAHNGWFPQWVKIVKAGKKTESGYEPLDLVKAAKSEIPF